MDDEQRFEVSLGLVAVVLALAAVAAGFFLGSLLWVLVL